MEEKETEKNIKYKKYKETECEVDYHLPKPQLFFTDVIDNSSSI